MPSLRTLCVRNGLDERGRGGRTTNPNSCLLPLRSISWSKNRLGLICRASTIRVPVMPREKTAASLALCIHGAVPLHPFMAQGVLMCGGYITSREAEKANTPAALAAHARKHTHKKSIQKNLTRRGIWREKLRGRGKGSLSCLGPKTELSATMTNQLCALAGSNSVWRPRVWRATER